MHRAPTQCVCVTDCYFIVNVRDLPFASPIATLPYPVADPDLQISCGGGGGGGGADPPDCGKGGGMEDRSSRFCDKGGGGPGPLPWIRHCYLRYIVVLLPQKRTFKILQFLNGQNA